MAQNFGIDITLSMPMLKKKKDKKGKEKKNTLLGKCKPLQLA